METTTLKDFQFYLLKQAFSGNTEKRDLILEFIDKVLLVEIKNSELRPSSLEVKRTVISLEKSPSLEKPVTNASLEKSPSLEVKPKKRVIISKSGKRTEFITSLEKPATVTITRNRSGNGHKREAWRKLYDWEKNIIRAEFVRLNGIIHEDACLGIQKRLSNDVAIFQVTGFVTLLHKYISLGRLRLPDMISYERHLKQKRKLWAQYERNRARRLAA